MAPRTPSLARLDARLQLKRRELAEAADPDDLATLREDIDALLDERNDLANAKAVRRS